MITFLRAYVPTLIAVAALDILWLGVLMPNFYHDNLRHLMGTEVVWPAAILFYLVYAYGILHFAIAPAVSTRSFFHALRMGALLGLLVYAAYDLTNQATLRDWPVVVTVVDIAWGTVLTAISAAIGFIFAKRGG